MVASSGPGDPTELAGSGFEAGRAPFLRHGLFSGAGEVPRSPELRRVSFPLGRGKPAVWSCPESALQGKLAWETPGSVPDVRH